MTREVSSSTLPLARSSLMSLIPPMTITALGTTRILRLVTSTRELSTYWRSASSLVLMVRPSPSSCRLATCHQLSAAHLGLNWWMSTCITRVQRQVIPRRLRPSRNAITRLTRAQLGAGLSRYKGLDSVTLTHITTQWAQLLSALMPSRASSPSACQPPPLVDNQDRVGALQ